MIKTFSKILLILLLACTLPTPRGLAAVGDTSADIVIGQPNFTTNTQNTGGVGPNGLALPQAAIPDAVGNLFVVDSSNSRVLFYPNPISIGAAASRVFGQPNLYANNQNNSGVSASSLRLPQAGVLDGFPFGAANKLYIADSGNSRVLVFNAPLSGDTIADRVFGQPGFTSGIVNNGGVNEFTLALPTSLAVDGAGTLYVTDSDNHRVLAYQNPDEPNASSATKADRVFGQPDFKSNVVNNGGIGPGSLNYPQGVTLDRVGNLYIADTENHRVLVYTAPITDTSADLVIGQPDYVSNISNRGGTASANTLSFPFSLAVDNAGTLYIADYGNNRILAYINPLTSDTTADVVFGQPDFNSSNSNQLELNASTLAGPIRISVDSAGSLFTADMNNNRVLKYDLPPIYLQLYYLFFPTFHR